jgi:4-hydroxybenzoate polyprenyltransferase
MGILKLSKVARAAEWWEYKLPAMLAIVYATALKAEKNLYHYAPVFCLLILGIVIGATYVSVINDLTDIKEDNASGKHNRMSHFSPVIRILIVLLPVTAGFFFAYFFLHDSLSIVLYAACWIAFSLYSIPPFRLKKRGLWGVLADASGAHFFPTLFLVAAATAYMHIQINWLWFGVVGLWSLMYGLRGILWHQFSDREHDLKTGINTYASKKNPDLFYRQSFFIMAVELAALAFILIFIFKPLPVLALLLYVLMLFGYSRIFKRTIIAIVSFPDQPWHFAMNNYYQLLLPISLLLTSALIYPQVWFMVAAHGILFPVITQNTILDIITFCKAGMKKMGAVI